MAHFHDSALIGASGQGGYQIERSLRFNSADSAYLSRDPASSSNRKTWTWSGWVKKTSVDSSSGRGLFTAGIGSTGDSTFFEIRFGTASYPNSLAVNGNTTNWRITTQVFRDTSAWYHVVVAIDTTQATGADRIKIYINGVQITAFVTSSDPSLNADLGVNNSASTHNIGRGFYDYLNGYLTEVNFIDGQALTPSSFGETDTITGVWKPKRYSGTYGTNGFYLKFADNSGTTATTLGKDSSGNGNNWTPNNFSVTAGAGNDSMIDTPTPYADGGNGRGNYATLSPLSKGDDATLANGNLDVSYGSAPFPSCTMATFGMSSGKWYWETTITASSLTNTGGTLGVTNTSNSSYNSVPQYPGYSANGWGYSGNTGTKYNNGTSTAYGSTFGVNDVIGCAFDANTGKIWWSKNGTWQASGDPAAGTNAAFTGLAAGTYFPAIGDGGGTSTFSAAHNFGQRSFSYTPPAGFLALNTQNLPEPSIKKPSSYFDTKLYTGTAATLNITGLGFSPDLVWTKNRTSINNHRLYDTLRGTTKELYSSATDAETTDANSLTAFNSDGFTLGSSSGPNNSGSSYVSWCWDEGATPGFDIVTYTGDGTSARAISHSLGVAPSFVIVKVRSVGTENWNCWHTSLNNTAARILLNTTGAVDTGSPTIWGTGGINPTSTTFQVGSSTGTNGNTYTYVAYLWSEVAGFSKFGSYTGNGSADGPFVHCGFRPRWVMIKRTDSVGSWFMIDTARATYNVVNPYLMANVSNSEATDLSWDILSNGFKLRSSYTDINVSSGTFVFAAFSENPFKYSLAR